jgi:hypothetical protein
MLWLLISCAATGSAGFGSNADDTGPESGDSGAAVDEGPPPACTAWGEPTTTGIVVDPELDEISGVAPSIRNPGTLWVIEDRNNEAAVTGLDELGNTVLTIVLKGSVNEDMEDVDVVPCGETTCIVVADTGDNGHDRPEAAFVVVEEPLLGEPVIELTPSTYPFNWPNGADDNEALTHTNDGRLVMATKRNDKLSEFYTISAFTLGAVPERVGFVPTADDEVDAAGTQLTAISMWPDQSRLLIRTYREAFELVLEGGVDKVRSGTVAPLPYAAVDHVEAVAYDVVRRGYWTIPESTPAGPSPIIFIPCVDGID